MRPEDVIADFLERIKPGTSAHDAARQLIDELEKEGLSFNPVYCEGDDYE